MDNAYTEAINGRFSAQQMASDQVEGFHDRNCNDSSGLATSHFFTFGLPLICFRAFK